MVPRAGSAAAPLSRVRVRVPAKINLFLAVRGRRSDGLHDIVSVMQTISIHDELEACLYGSVDAEHPAARKHMGLRLEHDGGPALPDDDTNLALRAARLLATTLGVEGDTDREDGPVTVLRLHKRIPVAAGLAGGSADAAAALIALDALWGCGLDRSELRRLAAELGADVPFCLVGGTALATGTGTATAQVLCRGTFHWVVGVSAVPLQTAAVYAEWDRRSAPTEVEPDVVLHALRTDDVDALGAALHNELEPAAFALRPELATAKQALLDAGAVGAVLSGSGPTMLGLARSADHATELAARVADRFHQVAVATSPAGGPEVVG